MPEFASWGVLYTTECGERRVPKIVPLCKNSEPGFQQLEKSWRVSISVEQIWDVLMGLGQFEKELRAKNSQLIRPHVWFFKKHKYLAQVIEITHAQFRIHI